MVLSGWCLVLLAVAGASDDEEELRGPAEQQSSINLGAKLEGLVGTQLVGPFVGNVVTTNFVLEPEIQVQELSRTGKLTLSYLPWLLYAPAAPPPNKLLFNRIVVEAEEQLSRTTGVSVLGRLWIGDQTFSPVVNLGVAPGGGAGTGPGTPTTPNQVPNVTSVKLLDISTRAGFYIQTSRQLRLDFGGGFVWAQGLNAAAEIALPLQRGPFLEAKATLKLALHDFLTTTLRSGLLIYGPVFRSFGSNTENGSTVLLPHFNTGLRILGSEAASSWQHELSSTLTMDLGVGMGVFYQSVSYDIPNLQDQNLLWLGQTPVPAFVAVYPLVSADVHKQVPLIGQTLSFTAGVALRPIINQFTGAVVERGDVSALAVWGVGSRWLFVATGEFAAAVSPREVDARGELRAIFQLSSNVVLAGGGRIAYLNYAVPGAFNGTSWVFFFSIAGANSKLGTTAGSSITPTGRGFLQ
jgi:hypothetical protein